MRWHDAYIASTDSGWGTDGAAVSFALVAILIVFVIVILGVCACSYSSRDGTPPEFAGPPYEVVELRQVPSHVFLTI